MNANFEYENPYIVPKQFVGPMLLMQIAALVEGLLENTFSKVLVENMRNETPFPSRSADFWHLSLI